jgi:hypothetical protein
MQFASDALAFFFLGIDNLGCSLAISVIDSFQYLIERSGELIGLWLL